jgi:hypothetical protein
MIERNERKKRRKDEMKVGRGRRRGGERRKRKRTRDVGGLYLSDPFPNPTMFRRRAVRLTGENMASSPNQSVSLSLFALDFLTPSSIFNKGAEFHAWLVEERKINPEILSKDQEKKEFARFTEDYNTGQYSTHSAWA